MSISSLVNFEFKNLTELLNADENSVDQLALTGIGSFDIISCSL